MKQYIIANPPCGIYRGDLPVGYAYYHALLDIHARFLKNFEGKEIICPKYSLNLLGKRAENLDFDGTMEGLNKYAHDWIAKGKIRDQLNLSFSGILLDTSPDSIEQTTKTFRELFEGGYSFREGDTFYLDHQKIGKDFNLEELMQEINFFSERSRKEFTRLVRESSSPVRITKSRKYAVKNCFGGEEIAPIFTVSNLWEIYSKGEIDFMAVSEKELARYLVLRFLSRVPISKDLPMENVFIYNYIEPEGGDRNWNMEELTSDGVSSDSLRYAFAKCLSFSEQKTDLRKNLLVGGRNLVYLTGNLKRLFLKNGLSISEVKEIPDENYMKEMNNFKYPMVLESLETQLRKLSGEINVAKSESSFNSGKGEFFNRYLSLVRKLNPFCPFISEKVIKDLSTV